MDPKRTHRRKAGRSTAAGAPRRVRTVAEWADVYGQMGWSVIPLVARQKRPLVAWESYQTRAPARETVAGWLARWPRCNLGVVTGRVSGLVVLDVDPAHDGTASLEALEVAHAPLPPTQETRTGGGGRHLYFRHPGGNVRNRAAIAPGLDVRGDGGYVVAPPSIHPSGAPYEWLTGRGPQDIPCAALPGWLLTRITEGGGASGGHGPGYWRAFVRDGVAEGERNATVASITGHLLWHGVDPDVIAELLLAWNAARCRPPLPDDEVLRTVKSIRKTHERQMQDGDRPETDRTR